MKTTTTSRIAILSLGIAAALLLPPPAHSACDCSGIPTLGQAGNWPALGLGDVDVTLEGVVYADGSSVPGNVGVTGSGGSILVQGAAGVGGVAGHEFGSTVTCDPADKCPEMIPNGIFEQDMSGPEADARAASAAFAAMTPTQSYGRLSKGTTFAGNGCINVIEVTDDIHITGKRKITLSGTADDYFIINLAGDFLTEGVADVVLDGMEPSHVIFNMVTPGKRVELAGNSGGDFTILAPDGEVYLHGNSGGRGAYYAGVDRLLFQGSTEFVGNPFECGTPACPDPELTGANIQAPATPQGRSLGNSSFFYAWFDLVTYEGHLEHYRLAANGDIMDESNVNAIDPITFQFSATRDPYFDAAIPLRTDTGRVLYTTIGGAQVDFDTDNVSETDLNLQAGEVSAYPNYPASGVDDTTKLRDAVVGYLYGYDTFDPVDPTSLRATVLGDIFHSNPLFVGTPTTLLMHEDGYESFYSAYEQRDRVVYAGANDGIFHGFAAGAWYDPTDPAVFNGGTGEELFGYVPGVLLPTVKMVPRTVDENGDRLTPSFIDGNIVAADAWLGDGSGSDLTKSADEWATVVLAAFREGGRGYLALDATDPVAASGTAHYPYPKFLWEFTDTLMAESWSRPVITRVKLAGTALSGDHCGRADGDGDCREVWVVIFGAGYNTASDPNEDGYIDSTSAAWDGAGKAIFMVRLDNGQVLDSIVFDAADTNGHDEMKYAISSQPGVLDIDGDRFADIILIGDVAGQLWKWDVSAKGVDGADADTLIDNWPSGVFFNAPPVDLGGGDYHYKSMFFPPSAAWVSGNLIYAFGTGERRNLLYYGDATADDNNRLFVIRDPNPTGVNAIPATPYTEANLTNVTSTATDTDLTDMGYYLVAEESEKFITDFLIFAGHAIAASYKPGVYPTCGVGEALLYTFRLYNAAGYFDANATPEAADRYFHIGSGIPSTPRISIAPNPGDDIGFINTSDKEVLDFEPPLRDAPESSVIYWKQEF